MKITIAGTGYVGLSNAMLLAQHNEKEAEKIMLGMQSGDVERTYADTARLETAVGYKPAMEIEEDIAKFVEWYKNWNKI